VKIKKSEERKENLQVGINDKIMEAGKMVRFSPIQFEQFSWQVRILQ